MVASLSLIETQGFIKLERMLTLGVDALRANSGSFVALQFRSNPKCSRIRMYLEPAKLR